MPAQAGIQDGGRDTVESLLNFFLRVHRCLQRTICKHYFEEDPRPVRRGVSFGRQKIPVIPAKAGIQRLPSGA
jgi:hypothetical protein